MTMEVMDVAGIDQATVDEVVIGAMAMLVEDGACEVSSVGPASADDVTVAVYCDANQQSAVVLRCSRSLANHLTEKMLELSPDSIESSDVLDATGELVNIIAGNLRGLVSSPGPMTAPFVVEQEAYEQFPGTAANTYRFAGEAMQVLRI